MHDSHTAVTWAKAGNLVTAKISWRNQQHTVASLWVPRQALYHFDGAVKFCLSFILANRGAAGSREDSLQVRRYGLRTAAMIMEKPRQG